MIHSGSVTLYTQRLKLRAYKSDDYQAMYNNWASHPEVARYVTWAEHASPEVTKQLVDMWVESYVSPTVYRWGIELKGELIGDISVVRWNETDECCEIGYCLCPRFWNQGIMSEALFRVITYLFETVGFHRIELRHDSMNPASGRVMQKCGLKFEGISRQAKRRKDGSWMDICSYAILSTDKH